MIKIKRCIFMRFTEHESVIKKLRKKLRNGNESCCDVVLTERNVYSLNETLAVCSCFSRDTNQQGEET